MKNLLAALMLLPLFLAATSAVAGEHARVVRVGLGVVDPFVIDLGSGNYSGLAFNLWEKIAERHDVKSEYFLYHSLGPLLEDVHAGKIDIVVGNISVSYERAKNLKFSFPWYDGGLRILVKNERRPVSVWSILQQRGQIAVYMLIGICVVFLAIGYALLRWRNDRDFPVSWHEGLSMSLYEVVSAAVSGASQKNVLGWPGHLTMTVWILFGFILLTYVTSTLASAMTIAGMHHGGVVNSFNDLPGKRVGVLSHSIGEQYMRETGARLLVVASIEEGVNALMQDDVDALVMDAAELEYWVHSHPKMDVEVVGNVFNPHKYAFAVNKKHAHLMDLVSEEIIRLLDNGTVEGLKDKYFGRVRF